MNKTLKTVIAIATIAAIVAFWAYVVSTGGAINLGSTTVAQNSYLPTTGSSTVTTSSTVVLATSTGREYAIITNDSANTLYISIGSPAVVGKGIRLGTTTGDSRSYEIKGDNLFQGPVYGISTASSNVTTLEK